MYWVLAPCPEKVPRDTLQKMLAAAISEGMNNMGWILMMYISLV